MQHISIVRVARSQDTEVADALERRRPETAFGLGTAVVHGAGQTQWWFDARGVTAQDLLEAVERSNCTHVLCDVDTCRTVRSVKEKVVWLTEIEQLSHVDPGVSVLTPVEEVRTAAISDGRQAGLFLEVADLEKEFQRCVEVCERGDDFVVIDIEHATYIPYELLIAKAQKKGTRVLRSVPIKGLDRMVTDVDQSLNAFATMEQGIGVLFRAKGAAAIASLSKNLAHRQAGIMPLVRARVEEVQHTGLGHRVCVDTTSMMTAEEGMIVGSTGWGGIFVCSETHYLPHMNPREFRVNAGAVHSYVWGPDGQAMYLSEMCAGSEVVAVDLAGNSRVVTIGRAKVERRPMLKVRCSVSLEDVSPELSSVAEAELRVQQRVTPVGERTVRGEPRIEINTFLQNDWHVRVMAADGKVRHCTLLQPGDELLAHVDLPGRHTGMRVTEHILER